MGLEHPSGMIIPENETNRTHKKECLKHPFAWPSALGTFQLI
jgi:hypothetical protein